MPRKVMDVGLQFYLTHFKPIVASHLETISSENQMTGFCIKSNTGLKWAKNVCIGWSLTNS